MTTGPLRLVGFDLGVHLGCVAIDVTDALEVGLVARHTIHVGEIVELPEPIEHTRKNGSTWIQRTERIGGPEARERATIEAVAWAQSVGAEGAAIEWTEYLQQGSRTPVLHTGQVGQSLFEALRRAGVPVHLYARSTALALVRRLTAARGGPVLPGVVKSRAAELTPVLDALVIGWGESRPAAARNRRQEASDAGGSDGDRPARSGGVVGPRLEGVTASASEGPDPVAQEGDKEAASDDGSRTQNGAATDARRPLTGSREDRRPEHETDACAVALAHVATLAGITVEGAPKGPRTPRKAGAASTSTGGAPVGWRERRKQRSAAGQGGADPAGCMGCARNVTPGPTHRRRCAKWQKYAGVTVRPIAVTPGDRSD